MLERSPAVLMRATDLFRVINSKSENFTLSVAVRPSRPRRQLTVVKPICSKQDRAPARRRH